MVVGEQGISPLKPEPQIDSNSVIETTTRRRVVPAVSEKLGFWEYLADVELKNDWDRHAIYVYRDQPAPRFQVTKCGRTLRFIDGHEVAISDQEEVEGNLQRRCGGGRYQFLVKRGPSINSAHWLDIGSPPRSPAEVLAAFDRVLPGAIGTPANPTVVAGSTDGTYAIASKAIDTVAGADRDAIRIAVETLTANAQLQATTAATIRALAANPYPAAAPPSESDQLMKMMMTRLMEKMLDRMDAPAASNQNLPIVNQILDAGLKRLLEPPLAGNGTVSAGAELVHSLPSIASYIVDGLKEWRAGMEAQRDGLAMMNSPVPANAPGPAPRVTPPPAQAQMLPPQPRPVAAPPPPSNGAPSLEFIESRIVEIIRQPISAEEAADRALDFLDAIDGENPQQSLVAQLVSSGGPGLLALFHNRPILRTVTGPAGSAQSARLDAFIAAFVRLQAKDEEESGTASKVN